MCVLHGAQPGRQHEGRRDRRTTPEDEEEEHTREEFELDSPSGLGEVGEEGEGKGEGRERGWEERREEGGEERGLFVHVC